MKKLLLIGLLFGNAMPIMRLTGQSCKSADTLSVDIIDQVIALATTSDSVIRTSLQVPGTTTSQIALVTDQTICLQAWQAVDSTVKATNPNAPANSTPRALYVVTVGSYKAVVDPEAHVGEWFPMYFFDPDWNYVNMLVGWR
jgi:hypothetical protein